MKVWCKGVAILEDASGGRFEVKPDDLDWAVVGVHDRGMGTETHYMATVEHEVLGILSWNLWEYPAGLESRNSTEVGLARIVADLDYGLDYEDDQDFEEGLFDPPLGDADGGWEDLPEDEQVDLMMKWFNVMFEDPQNQTPYADKESRYNYNYVWGGPYDALDELGDRFAGIASDEAITKAAELVQDLGGIYEWAPSDSHPDMRRFTEEAMAEPGAHAHETPSLEEIRRQVSESPKLRLGTAEEVEARDELLALLQDLGPLVARSTESPAHGGIGHNRPPVEMALPQTVVISVAENINVIEAEVSSDSPDAGKVVEAAGALEGAREEIGDFLRMTKDQVKSQGSKALATAIIGGISLLIVKVTKWFMAALGLSFF